MRSVCESYYNEGARCTPATDTHTHAHTHTHTHTLLFGSKKFHIILAMYVQMLNIYIYIYRKKSKILKKSDIFDIFENITIFCNPIQRPITGQTATADAVRPFHHSSKSQYGRMKYVEKRHNHWSLDHQLVLVSVMAITVSEPTISD